MSRSRSPVVKKSEKSGSSIPDCSPPPPALLPLDAMPALDMTEYEARLYPEEDADVTLQPRSTPRVLEIRPKTSEHSQSPIARARTNLSEVANSPSGSGDEHLGPIISRPSHHAASRIAQLGSPDAGTQRNPSSTNTTPYLAAFASGSDLPEPPSKSPPLPTSPTAEALCELDPPPGNGPRHDRKMRQRISIWAQEVADINLNHPTKPMPKPLKEWERLGRRVLKRRGQDEWPGPMQDNERCDETKMYSGKKRPLFEGEYHGPHPGLNRGDGQTADDMTSPTPPTPCPDTPDGPTRNILIDNMDGANDSPDDMRLSPSNSGQEVDVADLVRKQKIATEKRLQRAAKLLKKQTQARDPQRQKEKTESSEESSKENLDKEAPEKTKKKHIDVMEWRKSFDRWKA